MLTNMTKRPLNYRQTDILCPHFTRMCSCPLPPPYTHGHVILANLLIFSSSCGELLRNNCGSCPDLLGVEMTFGSSLMQSSSSMWTRVALRVTTPFPLQTLLGSKSENIQNLTLAAIYLFVLVVVKERLAAENPTYCYFMLQIAKIELLHQNQAIKLIFCCPVKLITMSTLPEVKVERLKLALCSISFIPSLN